MKIIKRSKLAKRYRKALQKHSNKDTLLCLQKREIVLSSSLGTNFQQEEEEYYLRDLLHEVYNKTYNVSTLVYVKSITLFENNHIVYLYDYFTQKLIVKLTLSMDAMTKYCNIKNYIIVSQLI